MWISNKRLIQYGEKGYGKNYNSPKINGKCLTLMQNMYTNVKSREVANDKSSIFSCKQGVKQGENLSIFLFSIFFERPQCIFDNKAS